MRGRPVASRAMIACRTGSRDPRGGDVALNVAIVEDDARYRESLETLLSAAEGFRVAGTFGAPDAALQEAARQAAAYQPEWGLVLMDLQLPGMSGIEATRRLKGLLPDVIVVVLTVFEEPATILEAICAGADGYLLKKSTAPELLAQLRAIAAGGAPLSPAVARTVLEIVRAAPRGNLSVLLATKPAGPTRLGLTDREQQVLHCLVRGMGYKQAADGLGVSVDTVRAHIRSIYRKLQVHSSAEAIVRAIRDRLV